MSARKAYKIRETKETKVEVSLDLDEEGDVVVNTPVPFFNHMLTTLGTYMGGSLVINAVDKLNYDDHHVVEDVAIVLGEALKEALGDKKGIKRFSSIALPMDEALVLVALDISNRGMALVNLKLRREMIGGHSTENVYHFYKTFAANAGITLHIMALRGKNTHHIIEASFKGLGLTLYEATRVVGSKVRSTKGVI